MPMNVEELQVLISANADQFGEALRQIQTQLGGLNTITQRASNQIGGSFTGSIIKGQIASQLIVNVVKQAISGFSNLTGEIAKSGSEYMRLRGATDIVARNSGMTTKEIDKFRESLAKADVWGMDAENTLKSFAMGGLMSMTNGLKAYDTESQKWVTGNDALLVSMRDLSSAGLIDAGQGVQQLTQFIQTGMGANNNNLLGLGRMTKAYKQYTDQMGGTVNQMSMAEQRQARINIVMEQGRLVTGAYTNAVQSSSGALASIKEIWKNLETTLGSALEPIFATALGGVKEFVQGVSEMLTNNIGSVQKWAMKVAGEIMGFIRLLGTILMKIPVIGKYFEGMANFKLKGSTGVEDIGKGADKSKKSVDALKKSEESLAGFDEMNVLKKPASSSGSTDTTGTGGGGVGAMGNAMIDEINKGADAYLKKFTDTKDALMNVFNDIKMGFINAWDMSGMQGVVDTIVKTFNDLLPQLTTIWGNLTALWDGFWGVLSASAMKNTPVIVQQVAGLWKSLWDNIYSPYIALIGQEWADFSQMLLDTWNKYGAGIVDGVFTFIQNILKLFQSLYDNVIYPIIKPFLEMFKNLWNDSLKSTFQTVVDFVGKLISSALEIYNKFISPIVLWILKTLKPVFEQMGTKLAQIFGDFFTLLSGVVKGIFQVLGGLIDFITGVLTGNWKKAWEGIKSIFTGIFNAIASVVKFVLNTVIDTINEFIKGINRINIPTWLGGSGKGLGIGLIPRLAQGGVIESPTLAMVGENGREAVMPLENNTGWITELAQKINSRGNGQPVQLVVRIGEDKFFDKIIELYNDKSLATNTNLIRI
jgi:phage-related protein